jgi:hypothetical protein
MDGYADKQRDRQANRYIQWMQKFRILNNTKCDVLMTVTSRLWLSLM